MKLDQLTRTELKALMFYRWTGYLAPGKDQPAVAGPLPISEAQLSEIWRDWIAVHSDTINACCDAIEELEGDAEKSEKDRRIYYQGIVYAVCNQLDRVFGGKVVCGTADAPTTDVQDRVESLVEMWQNQKARLAEFQAKTAELQKIIDEFDSANYELRQALRQNP